MQLFLPIIFTTFTITKNYILFIINDLLYQYAMTIIIYFMIYCYFYFFSIFQMKELSKNQKYSPVFLNYPFQVAYKFINIL